MKVFDYSNGKKGALLTNMPTPSSCHGSIVDQDERRYRIALKGELFGNYTLSFAASTGRYIRNQPDHAPHLNADIVTELGAEAVLYCDGSYTMCGEEVWSWHVTATPEWIRKAHKKGWITLERWDDHRATNVFLEA